jgi:hypothetical protein
VIGIVDDAEIFMDRIVDVLMFRVQPERDLQVVGIVDFSAET